MDTLSQTSQIILIVYDFGAVCDEKLKTELFFIADFYLQFGWIGLSIVEAFAYGKSIITMRRSEHIKHSVEHYYLKNKYDLIILNNITLFHKIISICKQEIKTLALNAYNNHLQIRQMINNIKQHFKL